MSLYLGENLISGVATPIQGARNIGQIIQSTIPLTDAGLHLLDGALINGSGSYADFVTYIAGLVSTYPDLFISENDWQTSVTNYGVCGKFVYNSTNRTVRLPKYSNKIFTQNITQSTVPVIGNGKTLGLTNGSGAVHGLGEYQGSGYAGLQTNKAAGRVLPSTQSQDRFSSGTVIGVSTDPATSGLVAQLSNITTSLDGYYYIVIATSTKTDIQVDIDNIATDLNGKADTDLSNCTKPHIVETYVNGTSWYRIYSDGWCEQGGIFDRGSDITSSGGFTITLLKGYNNTLYTPIVINGGNSSGGGYGWHIAASDVSKTATSFSGYAWKYETSNRFINWETKGYIS